MSYSKLIEKANKCRINALRCESEWAKTFWMTTANKLETMAGNMPVSKVK